MEERIWGEGAGPSGFGLCLGLWAFGLGSLNAPTATKDQRPKTKVPRPKAQGLRFWNSTLIPLFNQLPPLSGIVPFLAVPDESVVGSPPAHQKHFGIRISDFGFCESPVTITRSHHLFDRIDRQTNTKSEIRNPNSKLETRCRLTPVLSNNTKSEIRNPKSEISSYFFSFFCSNARPT